MSTRGRLRLLVLACLVGLLLSLRLAEGTEARGAALSPAPDAVADRPGVREIMRAAERASERLQQVYSVYVFGLESGYGFAVDGQVYLPARRIFDALGGGIRLLSRHRLLVEVPERPFVVVRMHAELDRGYVSLDDVRHLLPPVQISQRRHRIDIGTPKRLPLLPSPDGGLRAVWLNDQLLSGRALLAAGELYVPLYTGAQFLAATAGYDAVTETGLLDGQPVEARFAPLAVVSGVPYVRLKDLLRRLRVQGAVRVAPADSAGHLVSAEPEFTVNARATAAPEPNRVVYAGPGEARRIALTFDDYLGPWIPVLLEELDDLGVRATFFAIGASVQAHPDLAREIVAHGHQIAGHTFHHYNLFTMTLAEVRAELAGTQRAIRRATGVDSLYWRPPGGYLNDAVIEKAAVPLGLTTVFWSINSDDSSPRITPAEISSSVLKQAFPGAIVAMHMGSAATRQALPRIVSTLRQQGYSFVTVDELLHEAQPAKT